MLINEMEIFYQVVVCHSFARAARHLGVSASHVSKKVSQLESALGAHLLTRSTRQMTLTEAGQVFFQQCERVVEQAQRGYDLMAELQGHVAGTLTIAAPPAFGECVLPNVIASLSEHHPDIVFQLVLSSQLEDIIAGGFDVVLRSAQLATSNLVAQKVWDIDSVVCATPTFWRRYGVPSSPSQLSQLPCVQYGHEPKARTLTFSKGQREELVTLQPVVYCSLLSAMRELILTDQYFSVLPVFMVQALMEREFIECVLTDHALAASPLYAMYPKRDHLPPKTQLFLTTVKNTLSNQF